MYRTRLLDAFLSAVASCVLLSDIAIAQPSLGDPPHAPTNVLHLPRGPLIQSTTGGFNVDTFSREEVRGFYNAIYPASDGFTMNSSADVVACLPGTNATAYVEAVLRRINWFRAMAGVPASVTFNASNNAKDQQAALMLSANTNVTHSPPPGWKCYTTDAAEAAQNSNVAVGYAGTDAIFGYIWDFGFENAAVGHRRWLLYPQTQVMGTGDVPAQNGRQPANANWVYDGNLNGPRPATRTPFVAWPPAGFVPAPVVFPRWSLSLPNAGFFDATVTMTSNGVPIAVTQETPISGYGERTLVWVPLGLNAASFGTRFPFSGIDTIYSVTVSNITGAAQTSYTYLVTIFDPNVPGAGSDPTVISGPSQPYVNFSNTYLSTTTATATGYEWRTARPVSTNFSDGAENGLANFIATTSPGYPVVTNKPNPPAGNSLFHLAQPIPATDQLLQLNRLLLPGTNTQLRFRSRLAEATTSQWARVQVSLSDGTLWQDIYGQAGTDDSGEGNFTLRTLSLSNYAGHPLLLRFNYSFKPPGLYKADVVSGYGWYLDDIVVTNAQQLVGAVVHPTPAGSYSFIPTQAGAYTLEARALIFGEFPLDWGPLLQVTATMNAPPVLTLGQPVITNGQVRVDFALQSGSASTFKLLQADQPNGPWSTNTSATLTTNVPGSSYRFNAPVSGAVKFYRVQTP